MRNPLSFTLVFLVFSLSISAQCSISETLIIPDLTPVSANLLVEGATNDDLSGSQAVCGISLEFEHEQIGDLTIELTSPSGQSIVLVGPTGSFGKTTFTDWNVLFLPCSNNTSPDPGFLGEWNNNQDWGILGNYSGSYHPYIGCLEDFNTGSINGNWNIQILDNTMFDVGQLLNATIFFCDQSGIACNLCEADAGTFNETTLNVCSSNTDDIILEPQYSDGGPGLQYGFYYVIRQGNTIIDITTNVNLTGFDEGVYQICGFSILVDDIDQINILKTLTYPQLLTELDGTTPSVCGVINESCVEVNFSQQPITVDRNVTICDGSSYELGGQSFSVSDMYEVQVPQSNGCDSIYNLNLQTTDIQAVVNASVTTLSCTNPEITINSSLSNTSSNSIYSWSTVGGSISGPTDQSSITVSEPGTYILEIIDGACVSTSSIQILANSEAPVLTLTGGTITCDISSVLIDLEADDDLSSTSWSGPNGFNSNDEDVTVFEPGVYTVNVISANGCEANKSITINEAGSVPDIVLFANELSCGFPQTTIQVNASSNSLTYSWTGPNGFTFNGKNPVVSEPGTYFVTATDPFGCTGDYSIEITGDPNALNYSIDYSDLTCPDLPTIILVDIDNPNAFIKIITPEGNTITDNMYEASLPGTYTIEVLSNGCLKTEEITINEDFSSLPEVQIIQDDLVSCDSFSTTLRYEVINNGDQISEVYWYGPGGFIGNDDFALAEYHGAYYLLVETFDGCFIRTVYSLQYDTEIPIVTIISEGLTCTNETISYTTTANEPLDYFWTGPNGFVSTDSVITDIEPGSYVLLIENAEGCQRQYLTSVSIDTVFTPFTLFSTPKINCNIDSILLEYNFLDYNEFMWTGPNGFTSEEAIVKVAEGGEYMLELVDGSSGCFDTVFITVEEDFNNPDLQLDDQSFDCGQESLLIEVLSNTPNVTYSWSGPNGYTSNANKPLITDAGTYSVTVTGTNGCETIQSIDINQDNQLPDVSASFSNDLDCVQTQSIVTGSTSSNGATFIWEGPNNVFTDPVITVEEPGIYTFIVTGLNGCSDSIALDIPFTGSLPEFTALGDTLFCGDIENIIDVEEITDNVTFNWEGPNGFTSTNMMNVVADPGVYILTGIGDNSCVSTDTAFVAIDNEAPVLNLADELDTLTCTITELNLEITSDKTLTTAVWNGPDGLMEESELLTVEVGGTYTFVGIAENNCETSLVLDVVQDVELPIFSISSEVINCDNTKADINLEINDPGSTFEWEGPSFSSDSQNPVVEIEGTYNVTVTGTNGCVSDDEVEVLKDIETPDLTVKNDTLPCDGSPILLFASSTTEDVVIQWLGPDGFDSIGTSPLTDLEGTYFVTATGPNGCSSNETVTIYDVPIFPEYEIGKSSDITCEVTSTTFTAIDVEDDESFIWIGPEDFTSTELSFDTQIGGMYYLEVTGITGCIERDSVMLEVDTLGPTVEITQIGRILCDVNEVSISGEGSSVGPEFNYHWSSAEGTVKFGENSLNPIIEGAGTYRLVVENDDNGCSNLSDILIEEEVSTLEAIDLSLVPLTCKDTEDGMISIVGVSGGTAPYRFAMEGVSFSEIDTFENLSEGEYSIFVKDSFGCILDTLVNLESQEQIEVDLGEDAQIDLGESFILEANTNFTLGEIDTIIWTPRNIVPCDNCLEFEFIPGENMVVSVLIIDKNGCRDEDQIIIRVDNEIKLFIPNVFTPDDNGVNDLFSIAPSPNVELINYFMVFDRWGTKVFEDENFVPGNGKTWNGKFNGQQLKQGAYVYVAEIVLVNGKKKIIKGDITIFK